MDVGLEPIKMLYQGELDACKRQIDDLKAKNKDAESTNNLLLDKIRSLQELVEKAKQANQDLHTAFEHVREQNMKLQMYTNKEELRTEGDDLALETMQRQYVNLARESVSWISDKDKLSQRIKYLERECERYARDNITLGKQVRHLLRSLEEERGMIIRSSRQPTGPVVTASDVIDSHLVTFKSIEELQQQNQKLLSLVKDMTQREEEKELRFETEDTRRLSCEIETLKSQLESLKDEREKIMNAFNTILKERDLFKILLCKTRQVEHMTPEIFQRMVSIACSAGPVKIGGLEDTQDKDAHILDLKSIISKLEQEVANLRSELETIKSHSESEIGLKTQLLQEAQLKILTETQRADVLDERNRVLETNISNLTTEFDDARTKTQRLTFEAEQLAKEKKELNKALEEERQLRRSELADILIEIQTKSERVNELRFELEDTRAKCESVVQQKTRLLKEAQSKLLSETQRIRELNERNRILETDMNNLTTAVDEARTEIQRLASEARKLAMDNEKLSALLEQERELRRSELEAIRTDAKAQEEEHETSMNLEPIVPKLEQEDTNPPSTIEAIEESCKSKLDSKSEPPKEADNLLETRQAASPNTCDQMAETEIVQLETDPGEVEQESTSESNLNTEVEIEPVEAMEQESQSGESALEIEESVLDGQEELVSANESTIHPEQTMTENEEFVAETHEPMIEIEAETVEAELVTVETVTAVEVEPAVEAEAGVEAVPSVEDIPIVETLPILKTDEPETETVAETEKSVISTQEPPAEAERSIVLKRRKLD